VFKKVKKIQSISTEAKGDTKKNWRGYVKREGGKKTMQERQVKGELRQKSKKQAKKSFREEALYEKDPLQEMVSGTPTETMQKSERVGRQEVWVGERE